MVVEKPSAPRIVKVAQGPGGPGGADVDAPGGFVAPVVVASTSESEVASSPPSGAATIDGSAVVTGWRVLLTAQTTNKDNGVWIANTAEAWTRPSDWASGATIDDGILVASGEVAGSANWSSIWQIEGPIVVDTDAAGFILVLSTPALGLTSQSSGVPTSNLNGEVLFNSKFGINLRTYTTSGALSADPTVSVLTDSATAMTLPAAASRDLMIVKNQTGGPVTITPNGADTIDETAGASILPNKGAWVLQPDGATNWIILATGPIAPLAIAIENFGPAGTGGTGAPHVTTPQAQTTVPLIAQTPGDTGFAEASVAYGPVKGASVLLDFDFLTPAWDTGTVTLYVDVYVSDATGTNTLHAEATVTGLGPDLNSQIGCLNFTAAAVTGSDLSVGTGSDPIVKSAAGTIPYWVTATFGIDFSAIS